jgi:hypothetical protein
MSKERNRHAILKDKKVFPINNILMWARWFETAGEKKRVGFDTVGEDYVSTVFLGLNHEYFGGEPLWFETMVFGGPLDGECERYTTYEQAELGHKKMLARMKEKAK